jgi:hypothetical protein
MAVILTRRYGGFSVNSTDFAIQRSERVTAVILEKQEERVMLTKEESGWMVNNRYEARPSAIWFLLETLSRISIKSTVPESQFREEWSRDSSSVIRVEIKEKPGRVKSFLVYPVTSNPYGNYFKKRKNGMPFIVNIPGYSGNVGSLFVTSEKFWLPHTLFAAQPSEIRMVKLITYDNELQSFVIYQESPGSVKLFSLPEEEPVQNLDTTRVYRYLSYFNNLRFERWVFDSDSIDSHAVLSSHPSHQLTIQEQSGRSTTIRTYPIIRGMEGSEPEIDLNRIYASINDVNELVVVRYVDIDPVLKERNYFVLNNKE